MSYPTRAMAAVVLPLAFLLGSTATAAGWSAPVRVAWLGVSAKPDGPSLAVHAGDHHLAAAGGIHSPGIRLLTDRSGMWRSSQLTDDEAGAPSIAVGDDGAVHIAYARDWSLACTSRCSTPLYHLSRRGGEWRRTRLIGGHNVMPTIALDVAGRPHVAALHRTDRYDWSLQLFTRTADGWSREVLDRHVDYGSLEHPNGPRIAINGDHIAISYLATPTPGTSSLRVYERTGDGPAIRSDIPHSLRARSSDVAFDAEGTLHVAYSARVRALWHATRDAGGAWIRTRISTHVDEHTGPSLVAWGMGRLAIATEHDPDDAYPWVGAGKIELFTNRGGPWTSRLLTDSGDDRLPSLAATADGQLRLTFIRAPRGEPATIWFIRRP